MPPPNTTQLDGGNYGTFRVLEWQSLYDWTKLSAQPVHDCKWLDFNTTVCSFRQYLSASRFDAGGFRQRLRPTASYGSSISLGGHTAIPAILDAYDAKNVSTLLYSSPASGSGAAGNAVKFTVPTIANGKVYVGSQTEFTVFGLLP